MSKGTPLLKYFTDPLWNNNQVLSAILGICSALAVTINLQQALTMTAAVTFVTGCSSLLVSLLRNYTPDSVRMITQLAVISMFVTIVDQVLAAFMYDMSKTMSVYVGLIITNCLVMGRAEALARTVTPFPAFMDGIGAGLGYGWVLTAVAFVRELLGSGQLFGHQIIPLTFYATPQNPDGYQNFNIFVLPPVAFFLLGGLIWLANVVNKKEA